MDFLGMSQHPSHISHAYLRRAPLSERRGHVPQSLGSHRCRLYDHDKQRRETVLIEGGDFKSWAATTDADLKDANCGAHASQQSPLQVREPHRRSTRRSRKRYAACFILSRVCSSIRCRIPVTALDEPQLMWTAIEALAKPFKLTALPAELRNQIYREVLEPVRRVSITQWSRYQSATPSLMHACQQIRSECAFIHYAETAFTGHTLIRYGTHSGKPVLTDGMVRNWIMDVAQPFWRHLRHFSIAIIENIGGYVNSFNLELHYDDGEGEGRLVAILPQDLNEDWKSKIFDHIKDINKAADAGGWAGGERIVGAIMTRREVWMPRQYAELD